ncbi:type VI secretion system PAAR protein [Pectobacterium quasiaquaticum]|uniref:Type VI secretion system PAAR protein n=1 Tax=Pectobacterium quasiaquaticum TaxID=2774015 RepID=A0A9Q2EQS5_9GAMM|nr:MULTISPECIES: type VI secretion system PAAR protein [Pectobacterium]MBE5203346.1 type VI secretion system PAAR protein [Pectobacterium quasiaquaticum]MBE5208716.1 type VI secretion system PAAR protein [Pectobacterium quasiaquaticum]MBE5221126.1 type VI secretion system PAAR protein [Pectobacterium quasiaquaticum]MBN3065099.1 type VI secretion system PAAR protein [Pectobacterium aquaticum]URG49386.1 type VI secretion system PAAR protein [Pectobacterium quasiaquaticum]
MGNAVKLGDNDTGHGSHPPTSVVAGSSTVKVDGLPLARQGDPLAPHGHSRSISGGSSSVFIDGKPAARSGDGVSCGSVLVGGGTVNIG